MLTAQGISVQKKFSRLNGYYKPFKIKSSPVRTANVIGFRRKKRKRTTKLIDSKRIEKVLPFQRLSKELEEFKDDFADTSQFAYVKTF